MKKSIPLLLLAALFLPLLATAQDAGVVAPVALSLTPALPDSGILDTIKSLVVAAKSHAWGQLLFLAITVLVWVSRKFFEARVPALASPLAAVIKAFLLAFSGMLAAGWAAGTPLTMGVALGALQAGFAAAGGWSVLKFALELMAKKWEWAKWLLGVVLGKPAPAAPAVTPAGGTPAK